MISIKNQVPSVYYNASRDFQILGHLYEVVLNYVKTNADMLYLLPNGLEEDTRATELLATTLGFKLKRNYDKAQLAALVSIFPQLLKIKGTKRAIDLAGNALVKAAGVPGEFFSDIKDHVLTIKIPIELSDITLFIDLLPYILPFGLRVSIIRSTTIRYKVATPHIETESVMRKAFPSSDRGELHPLGLVKIHQDDDDEKKLKVEYSDTYLDTYFINPETGDPIAGQLGASPIIAFGSQASSRDAQTINEEENA